MQAIIITGTSQGLGKAFLDYYKEKDTQLVCISRRLLECQEEIFQRENKYFFQQDLNSIDEVCLNKIALHLRKIVKKKDEIVFVNNAGVVEPIGDIGYVSATNLTVAVNVNFLAPILLINMLLKLSETLRCGLKIINISSGAANNPIIGWGGYCATKAAVKMFLAVLKKQCENKTVIKVFDVDPGVLDTNMQKKIRSAEMNMFPQVEYFQKLKNDGKLKKPKDVVVKIARELIER